MGIKQLFMAAAIAAASSAMANSAEWDLALTLWSEARGEGEDGLRAVASVIWNRAGGDPGGIYGVIHAPRQFSCWNGGDIALSLPEAEKGVFRTCQSIAEEVMTGAFTPTTPAKWYHSISTFPKWAAKLRSVGKVGRHMFYAEKKPAKTR